MAYCLGRKGGKAGQGRKRKVIPFVIFTLNRPATCGTQFTNFVIFKTARARAEISAPNLNKGAIMKKQNKATKQKAKKSTKTNSTASKSAKKKSESKEAVKTAVTQTVKKKETTAAKSAAPKKEPSAENTKQAKPSTAKPAEKSSISSKSATPPKSETKSAQQQTSKPAVPQQPSKQTAQVSQDDLITVSLKFHPDSNGGHHHIIVENLGDSHVSVGLTTSKKFDKKHNNIPLEHSPLSNGKPSFILKKGTVDKKRNYNSPKQGQITQNDAVKVKNVADKAKATATKKGKK